MEVASVDTGSTGQAPATAAQAHGMRLEVVKLPEATRGFVLLPRRWVVERSFAWMTRFRRWPAILNVGRRLWLVFTCWPLSCSCFIAFLF